MCYLGGDMFNQICNLVKQGALILDVRSQKEYREGHNPRSLNIPIEKVAFELSRLPRERAIIVCCASGWRSHKAAQILKRYGIKNVYNACSWQNTICTKVEAC